MLYSIIQFLIAFLFACLIHEIGHILTALAQGVHVKQLGWEPYRGPFIRRASAQNHIAELRIALAGPLANILAAFMVASLNPYWFKAHMILGLSNLVPFAGSDGARILRHVTAIVRIEQRLAAVAARSI